MVRGIPNVTVPSINFTMAQSSGKMSLPVDSSSLIYSHFEHVSGVPAAKGTQGVSISKLNLLDVLIGQVNQIKKGALPQISPAPMAENLDARNLDALIEHYRNQIREARAVSAAMPYIPAPSAPSGAVFSLVA